MSSDNHLSAALVSDLANQVINLLLQNDVLVGVGFIKEDYGCRTRIQKRQ